MYVYVYVCMKQVN